MHHTIKRNFATASLTNGNGTPYVLAFNIHSDGEMTEITFGSMHEDGTTMGILGSSIPVSETPEEVISKLESIITELRANVNLARHRDPISPNV